MQEMMCFCMTQHSHDPVLQSVFCVCCAAEQNCLSNVGSDFAYTAVFLCVNKYMPRQCAPPFRQWLGDIRGFIFPHHID